MTTEQLPRRLVAILYADVAGYSRLTGADEEGTHLRLRDYLDVFSARAEENRGKVDHFAGDAVLAHFATATEAVLCAVQFLDDIDGRNREVSDERRIEFRVGVNLGEVIVDREEIWGEGVNAASRLQALAGAGNICVSESVRSALGNKLPYDYVFLGENRVKNVATPLRAYRLVRPGERLEPPMGARLTAGPRAATPWKLREGFSTYSSDSFRASRAHLPTLHGRAGELGAMEQHLNDLSGGSKMVFLHGSLGVGKTGLAARWWQDFSSARRRTIPYVLIFDCAVTEAIGNLTLDMAHMIFEVSRDTLERNRGIIVEQIVEVAKSFEIVLILDNLERLQARADAGEFRDYIRGDVGRLLLLLMHEACKARIVVCSQRYAPQMSWDISGRILPIRVLPLEEARGADVIRDIVQSQGGQIDGHDARRLSRRERGIPLNLMSAALAYAKHGEATTLSSAVWMSDPFDENMRRYKEQLSPLGLLVVRIISVSEEGLTHTTLRMILQATGGVLGVSIDDAIRNGLLENDLVISITKTPRESGTVLNYQISHIRFRNFFRADWEGSPDEGPAAREVHRLLANIAWHRAERWRDPSREADSARRELAELDYPPDPHPYEGSVRALGRYLQCVHHLLASVDPNIVTYRPRLADQNIGREHAEDALSKGADAELVVRFAYDVVYLQIIERAGQWYLSRALGADDTRLDLLARFFRLGSSTIDLSEGLLPLGNRPSDEGPRVPLLPRFLKPDQQGNLLFSVGLAAHSLGERPVATVALEAAFTQRRHHEDFRGAAKVLTTIADLEIQCGRISEWLEKCSYYLWEFARWEPGTAPEEFGALDEDSARDRARIVAELLARFAHAMMLKDGAERSLPYFRDAEQVRLMLGGDRNFLDGNIGKRYSQVLVRLGRYHDAESRNRHATRHHRNKKHELTLLAIERASIYRARGRLTHAEMALLEAEELTRGSGTGRTILFEYRLEEARLLIASARHREAIPIAQDIHWRARTRSLSLIECDALLLLADAHREGLRRDEYLELASEVIERTEYGYRREDHATLARGESAVATLKV